MASWRGGGLNYRFYLDADINAGADADAATAPDGGSPNAFALPSGQIIMTYSLYELLSTEEVAAVLAHEIAHVEKRHSLSVLISGAAWHVVSTMMLAAAGVLAAIPALSELAYSRELQL